MKKMKKILAMLLALTMVMGMGLTSMAEEATGTIAEYATISIEGASGTEYKYAQLVVEDRDSKLGWQFVNTTVANAFINAFKGSDDEFDADDAIEALIAIRTLENTSGVVVENKFVEAGDISPSTALGQALATLYADDSFAKTDITGSSVNLNSIGLYMITAENDEYAYIPMAVYVNTAYDDVDAKAKGAKKEITKVIDDLQNNTSVSEGDVVGYTATTIYPYYSADAASKTFTVTDTVTGATYNQDSVKVYLDKNADGHVVDAEGNVLEADELLGVGTDYSIVFNPITDATTFTITFNYNADHAGESVVIKYDVTVGAGANGVNNQILTNFDQDGSAVEVDKVQVVVTKTDDGDNPIPLEGATFAIYEAVEKATEGYTSTPAKVVINNADPVSKILYLKDVTSTALNGAGATNISNSEGKVTFTGLDAQKTYFIKETNAPVGYSLNDYYYQLVNTGETGVLIDQVYTFADFADVTVEDTKLNALPSTGGIGTTIFTVAGCGIMIAAAFFFFASRKKENE